MSIEIKAIPLTKENIPFHIEETRNLDNFPTVVSGKTYKDALVNLVSALNADEIDTENNLLKIKF